MKHFKSSFRFQIAEMKSVGNEYTERTLEQMCYKQFLCSDFPLIEKRKLPTPIPFFYFIGNEAFRKFD